MAFFVVMSTQPGNGAVDVELDDVINMNFNGIIDSDTVDTDSISIKDNITGEALTYTFEVSEYQLILTPEGMEPDTEYRVEISNDLQDIYGNTLQFPYLFLYTTTTSTLTAPGIISPINGAIVDSWPDFQYSDVDGAVSYEVVIALEPDLINEAVDQIPGRSYYWRVRAIGDAEEVGPWSSVATFYFRESEAETPNFIEPEYLTDKLRLSVTSPRPGAYNLASITSMSLTFNADIDSTSLDNCFVTLQRADGNLVLTSNTLASATGVEYSSDFGCYIMSGDWSVNVIDGRIIEFTPSTTTLIENMLYTIVVSGISGENGEVLEEDYEVQFYSTISPLYIDPRVIRSMALNYLDAEYVSDARILSAVLAASSSASQYVTDIDDIIIDTTDEDYLTAVEIVKRIALINLLRSYQIDIVTQANQSQKLGDYTYTVDDPIALEKLIDKLEGELDEAIALISEFSVMTPRIGIEFDRADSEDVLLQSSNAMRRTIQQNDITGGW